MQEDICLAEEKGLPPPEMRFNLPAGYLEVSVGLFRNSGGLFGIELRVSGRSGSDCSHFNDWFHLLAFDYFAEWEDKMRDHSELGLCVAEEVDGLGSHGYDYGDGEVVEAHLDVLDTRLAKLLHVFHCPLHIIYNCDCLAIAFWSISI
jgi:hypothetical protein